MRLAALLLFISSFASAQQTAVYQKKWMVQGSDTLPYRVLLPENFDSSKQYPVIFFLHGAGERGRDNERQLIHGSKMFAAAATRQNFPAIVLFPQCSDETYWSNVLRHHDDKGKRSFHFVNDGTPTTYMALLMQFVPYILEHYPVKKDQVYVGGLSMGGMGTFELVRRLPGTFAAAFPICGGANPETAKQMKHVSWWIFHGAKDDVVPPFHSAEMAHALKEAGADVKFTLYPNANHNSWDPAFAEPELLPWLFSKKLQAKKTKRKYKRRS